MFGMPVNTHVKKNKQMMKVCLHCSPTFLLLFSLVLAALWFKKKRKKVFYFALKTMQMQFIENILYSVSCLLEFIFFNLPITLYALIIPDGGRGQVLQVYRISFVDICVCESGVFYQSVTALGIWVDIVY